MTFKKKTQLIFDKHPNTKTDIPEFAWKCLEEFYGAKYFATKEQIKLLIGDWAKFERARKDIATKPEFLEEEDERFKKIFGDD